ncbi:MAG: SEL1-like repeat protein [Dechloromonas sp.]|nr:SEL1-like repeat protein [Dechloromonas sp.]
MFSALYENGLGVAVDREQAKYWYALAAEQGDAEGQRALAVNISSSG